MNISGRFTLVDRTATKVVVGCVGALNGSTLARDHVGYIRAFYHTKGQAYVVGTYEGGRLPASNFNCFVVFEEV